MPGLFPHKSEVTSFEERNNEEESKDSKVWSIAEGEKNEAREGERTCKAREYHGK